MILVVFSEKKFNSDDFIQAAYRAYCRITTEKPKELFIDRAEGKPLFRDGNGDILDIKFSLSHSGKFIACAVGKEEVGLDIQEHKDIDFKTVSKRLFNEEITDKALFFDRFSQGEARAKLDGTGLIQGMKTGGGRNFNIFDGYSVAVAGGTEPLFFNEYFEGEDNE